VKSRGSEFSYYGFNFYKAKQPAQSYAKQGILKTGNKKQNDIPQKHNGR